MGLAVMKGSRSAESPLCLHSVPTEVRHDGALGLLLRLKGKTNRPRPVDVPVMKILRRSLMMSSSLWEEYFSLLNSIRVECW